MIDYKALAADILARALGSDAGFPVSVEEVAALIKQRVEEEQCECELQVR